MTEQDVAFGTSEALAVNGVCVRLSGREVLHDVGFTIQAGEFVGLIGSNGAGKTTLLRVILGLQAPAAGTVRIAGRPWSRGSQLVGYVPQRISLDPEMPLRARDLVGLGLDGHRLGLPLPSARRRQQVDEMLTAVDALRFAGERVGNLSGGEQQRVLIAHALISAPRLLLLDEPLANLDIRSEREVIALLARIAKQQQIAVLISAHEMNPLLPVMDRIVYMAGGRAASGTTAQVVQPDVLSKLYGQHVDVIHIHDRILVVAGQGNGPDPAPEHEPGAAEPVAAEPSAAGDRAAEPSAAGDRAAGDGAAEHGAAEPSAAEHGSGGEHSAHIEHSRFADRT